MRRFGAWHLFLMILCFAPLAVGQETRPTTQPEPIPQSVYEKGPLLIHLPGIEGYLNCDRHLILGLQDGGLPGHLAVYDWTEYDPGLDSLHAYRRNHLEAQRVADMIVDHLKIDPTDPIILSSHSGGCGIAVWALEKLPPGVQVQSLLLLAPALSPDYDLSAALRHVSGQAYAFTSVHDTIMLEVGTKLFGTMDGVNTPAAGLTGFVMPPSADPQQYKKLVAEPFETDWMQYDDFGDHIGPESRQFAANIIAPMLLGQPVASTRPSAQAQ
jgi:pimeloyl-ACP methyl ester carboxylesterase